MSERRQQRCANLAAPASNRLAISNRDLRIIDRALLKLAVRRVDFDDAIRALRESVEEVIPDGRVFLLGHTEHGPIIGSIISGIGIVDHPAGVQLVRAKRDELPLTLGAFLR